MKPSYQTKTLGESVEFTCVTSKKVTWLKGQRKINDDPLNEYFGKRISNNTYWLKIHQITKDNEGDYVCKSSENFLVVYDVGTLEVISK